SRGELQGYTGTMYVHTGVILEPGGEWEYVIGSWPDNSVQPQATSLGNNQWELEIDDIRSFYDLPDEVETIHQIAMVFRSADGGRQSEDLFVRVYFEPVSVRWITPEIQPLSPLFVEEGDIIDIEIQASALAGEVSEIRLYVNDQLHSASAESILETEVEITETGTTVLRAEAENTQEDMDTSEIWVTVNPDPVFLSRPAEVHDGIWYHEEDPTQVTLSLMAPGKEFVYVIGDFNNWRVDEAYFMNQAEEGIFWLTIDGLEPGKEYAFQYLVDGTLRIADPYTEKVLDPWHDQEIIDDGRYPGLISYPHDKTEHAASVLQTAREPYVWQTTSFEPPDIEDLVIYELLIRDFLDAPENTYKGLRDTLSYLEQLGVNAIQLMPVTHFEGNLSWGYNPAFFFAADKYYGPRRELKKLIDEAHSRGMAVILDMVWNHSFGQSPLLRLYFDAGNNRPSEDNPWYMEDLFPTNPGMNFGYKFDHGSEYFIRFMDRANQYWLETYRVNGFRFDLTKGFTTQIKGADDPWGSRFDQERVDNLIRLREAIHEIDPRAYVILEHLADNDEELELSNQGMLLWGNMNHAYNEATMGWVSGTNSDVSWAYYKKRGWEHPHLISYMESHDEQRLMWKNLQYGNQAGAYDVTDLSTALERMILAGAFYFTIPGPKMLWKFGEIGYDYGLGEDGRGRTDPMPVPDQTYREHPGRQRLLNAWSAMIHLKREHDVFRDGTVDMSLESAVKRIYLQHDDMDVAIVGNFDVRPVTVSLDLPYASDWWNYFEGQSYTFETENAQMTLQPGAFVFLTSEELPLPEGFKPQDPEPIPPESWAASPNYPNPFSVSSTIDIDVPEASHISVTLYNILGQKVRTLKDEYAEPGTSSVTIPADGLASGVYLVRIHTAGFSSTQKIMVLR
ncbi:alpha-amylase family glycosyl hydrolase, partial [Balneolaceae bacterium ANBcel3]|nr:alpha-amylase family glycosyl hydrolase [Balneolaceae bacterium ANBcel3]